MSKVQADAFLSDPPERILVAHAVLIAGDEQYLVDKVLAAVIERVVKAPGEIGRAHV